MRQEGEYPDSFHRFEGGKPIWAHLGLRPPRGGGGSSGGWALLFGPYFFAPRLPVFLKIVLFPLAFPFWVPVFILVQVMFWLFTILLVVLTLFFSAALFGSLMKLLGPFFPRPAHGDQVTLVISVCFLTITILCLVVWGTERAFVWVFSVRNGIGLSVLLVALRILYIGVGLLVWARMLPVILRWAHRH